MSEAWIIDGVRSPRGKGKSNGSLHHIHPQELLAQVLNALVARTGIDAADVDDVIVGNGNSVGDQGGCIGRMAVLAAGWPVGAPGLTLNRFCGSGQQAITFAAMGIQAGHQHLVVGGGVESMSRWPVDDRPPDFTSNNPALRELFPLVPQGISADLIATLEGFTRDDVDSFAVESQNRCAAAMAEGRFDRSVVPITNPDGGVALAVDEFPRPGSTVEGMGKLTASFQTMGTHVFEGYDRSFDDMCKDVYPQIDAVEHVHHAGNSSGVVDGASAVLVASPDYAKAHGLKPRARIVMSAVAGAEPVIMLTAPGPSSQKCLDRAGMTVGDIDLFEVNEAFAVVPLKFMRDLDVSAEIVNVNGGACALGHPIGATGAMLLGTMLDELERRDLQTGLVTMCAAGAMAPCIIVERV